MDTLQQLRIGNFKAFGRTQTIPIRPITIVFGSNSAGKSSILQSILFAREASAFSPFGTSFDVRVPRDTGDLIDLGGFGQFLHGCDKSASLVWGAEILLESNFCSSIDPAQSLLEIESTVKATPPSLYPHLSSYSISIDNEHIATSESITASNQGLPELRLKTVNAGHDALIKTYLSRAYKEWPENKPPELSDGRFKSAIEQLVDRISFGNTCLLPDRIFQNRINPTDTPDAADNVARHCFTSLSELIQRVSGRVGHLLTDTLYLSSLRYLPNREMALPTALSANWFSEGASTWLRLRTDADLRAAVNDWLGNDFMKTPYRFEVEKLYRESDVHYAIQMSAITEAAQLMADHEAHSYIAMDLVDINKGVKVTPRDVGLGISQVVPVLVSALGSLDQLVAIEQPESQLHPALAAELGDVFIRSAFVNENTLILETHSEHLIRRVLRRIRESSDHNNSFKGPALKNYPIEDIPIDPDDVALLYVSPGESESHVTRLRISEDGRLIDPCPGGFFEEGIREMF